MTKGEALRRVRKRGGRQGEGAPTIQWRHKHGRQLLQSGAKGIK